MTRKKKMLICVCIYILCLIASVAICAWFYGQIGKEHRIELMTDTVVVRDTVKVETVIKDSVMVRHITQVVPVRTTDSCCNDIAIVSGVPPDSDSVRIDIPIQQKVYETEYYKAWISGYRPELDSINIYRKTETVTNTVVEKIKPKRWCGVVGVGAGYDGRHVSPYVGVTVGYRLF